MLWDEPTTGLDPETTRDISYLIRQMQDKYKVSSIVVTHDMICAKIVSDRIAVLKDGEYIVSDTYSNLEKSDNDFVKSFFGETSEENKNEKNNVKVKPANNEIVNDNKDIAANAGEKK
jgi:phospholipid/cholesterol/gamma-HCH transport system ATP-binding protein